MQDCKSKRFEGEKNVTLKMMSSFKRTESLQEDVWMAQNKIHY